MCNANFPQSLSVGFKFEPAILITEHKNNIKYTPVFASLYLNSVHKPVEWVGIEIRPGYIVGGVFWGFEIGRFARIKIPQTNFIVIAGLNHHSNYENNAHNSGRSYKKIFFLMVLALATKKIQKWALI